MPAIHNIRGRLLWIGALVAACVVVLIPRNVEERAYDSESGRMQTTTVRRVPINLGLDLRGGIHLALEVDDSKGRVANCAEAIQRAERIVRSRINEFGTLDPVVQIAGDCRLIVELPGIDDPERAKSIVQRTAFLEFRFTDSDGRFRQALPEIEAALRRGGVAVAPAPTGGAPLERMSTPSSLLLPGQIPGEFLVAGDRVAAIDSLLARPELKRLVPRGIELRWGSQPLEIGVESYRPLYALEARAIITGEEVETASAGRDAMTGASEVQFELSRSGGRTFADATGRNVGNHLAIVLDGRVEGQPPVIQESIGSSGRIQLGGRSLEQANDLALVLRAGALPVALEVVDQRTIGPSLGQDSIRMGVRASLAAVALVLIVMVGYYRFVGVLAVGGLALYMLLTLGGLAAFGFTLTLPGLAGFALSIGMALDANVLIFERIREELDAGKPVRSAVDEGFRNAMSAIVDSNVTTALTAIILYLVGTEAVQGFAITLLVGLAASMVSAIFVTRTFFLIWLGRRRAVTRIGALSVRALTKLKYDFIRVRRRAYAVSGVFIIPGILLLIAWGATWSIEFTGGTLVHVRTSEPVGTAAIRAALDGAGLDGAEIQRFGSDLEYVIRARLSESGAGANRGMALGAAAGRTEEDKTQAVAAAVRGALDSGLDNVGHEIARSEAVSPSVGAELQQKAVIAILFSFVTTLIYLAFRFEWRFGLAAILATLHDILASLAFIRYLDFEVSLIVVAAVLTVLGYSLNDTIIIFDRVRENLSKQRTAALPHILNRSINETLPRTLLTGGTTLATALVLAFFAGEVIRPFALVMAFGITVGTFSSIFVAAPILLWIAGRSGPAGTGRGRGRLGAPVERAGEPVGASPEL